MQRTDIIDAARAWIGTPYVHQHQSKGVGCDCANLVIAVGTELGIMDWTPDNFREFSGYGRSPNPTHMNRAMRRYLDQIDREDAQPGDIVWLAWRSGLPMHLAIIGEMEGRQTLIHAFADVGKVTEHGFTPEWHGRVFSYWRYRA